MSNYRIKDRILQYRYFVRSYRIIILEITVISLVIFGMNSQFEINKNLAIYNSFSDVFDFDITSNLFSFERQNTSLYDRFAGNEPTIKSEIGNSGLDIVDSDSYAYISSHSLNLSLVIDFSSESEPISAFDPVFSTTNQTAYQINSNPFFCSLFESKFYESQRFNSLFQINGSFPRNPKEILLNKEFANNYSIVVGNRLKLNFSSQIATEANLTVVGLFTLKNSEYSILDQPFTSSDASSIPCDIPFVLLGISYFLPESLNPLDLAINSILANINHAPWNISVNFQYGIALTFDRTEFYDHTATITMLQIRQEIGSLYQRLPKTIRITNLMEENLAKLKEITENFRFQILLMNLPVIVIFLLFVYFTFSKILEKKVDTDIRWMKMHGRSIRSILRQNYNEIAISSFISIVIGYGINFFYLLYSYQANMREISLVDVYYFSITPSIIDLLLILFIFLVVFLFQAMICSQNIPKFFHLIRLYSIFYEENPNQQIYHEQLDDSKSEFSLFRKKFNKLGDFWQWVKFINLFFLLVDLFYLLSVSSNILSSSLKFALNPYIDIYLIFDSIVKITGLIAIIRVFIINPNILSKFHLFSKKFRSTFRIPQKMKFFQPLRGSNHLIIFSIMFAFASNCLTSTIITTNQISFNITVGGNLQSKNDLNEITFFNSQTEEQLNRNISSYFHDDNKKIDILTDLYVQNAESDGTIRIIMINMSSYLQVIEKFCEYLEDSAIALKVRESLIQYNESQNDSNLPLIVNSIFLDQPQYSLGNVLNFQILRQINQENITFFPLSGEIVYVLNFLPGLDAEFTNSPIILLPFEYYSNKFEGFGYSTHIKLLNMADKSENITNSYIKFLSQQQSNSEQLIEPIYSTDSNSFNFFNIGDSNAQWNLFKILNASTKFLFPIIWVIFFMIIYDDIDSKISIIRKFRIRGYPIKNIKRILLFDFLNFLGLFILFLIIGILFLWFLPFYILKFYLQDQTALFIHIQADIGLFLGEIISVLVSGVIALFFSLRKVIRISKVKISLKIENSD